jgi:hypothetical protein
LANLLLCKLAELADVLCKIAELTDVLSEMTYVCSFDYLMGGLQDRYLNYHLRAGSWDRIKFFDKND